MKYQFEFCGIEFPLMRSLANYTVYYRPVGSQAYEMAVVASGTQVSVEI